MENKSSHHKLYSGLYLILFFLTVLSAAQKVFSEEPEKLLLKGIETFNRAYNDWDENEFLASLDFFKEASKSGKKDGLAEYWTGTAYFFLSQYNLFTYEKPVNKKRGIEYAKKGIEVLTKSIECSPDFSESYALRGVLRGMLIKMKPSSVFTQGRKVGKDRDRALAINISNPRVHYLTGVSFWHAPEILGGRDRALEHLLEAEKLFKNEKQELKDKLLPGWGRSTCLAFIGDIYLEEKKVRNAGEYYRKALEINPEDPLAQRGLKELKSLNSNN